MFNPYSATSKHTVFGTFPPFSAAICRFQYGTKAKMSHRLVETVDLSYEALRHLITTRGN
jgi:hypothetical protein